MTGPLRLSLDAHLRLMADSRAGSPVVPLAPDQGREAVAHLLGAGADDVFFMGGLRGSFQTTLMALGQGYPGRKHLIVGPTEAPAWLQFLEAQRRQGFRLTVVPLDGRGHLDLRALAAALDDDTLMVSVGWVALDTGAVAPLAEVIALAQPHGAFVHSNAAAALGYVPIDVSTVPVDLMTFSGLSIAGPERVGGLYVRPATDLASLVRSEVRRYEDAHPEEIGALGLAALAATARFPEAVARLARLRDRVEQSLLRSVPGMQRLGPVGGQRAPHLAAWAFEGVHAGALAEMLALLGFRIVSPVVCERHAPLPAGIEALGLAPAYKFGVVTIGLPLHVDESDLAAFATAVIEAVQRLRQRSPVARHLH